MIRFGILTFQDGFRRGPCDFYPLIRWRKEFNEAGITFNFFRSHENKKLLTQDIVAIDHRYVRELTVLKNIFPDKQFVIEFIEKLKSKNIQVILFDNGDAAGGRQWELIDYVDKIVKKQVFVDKKKYTENEGVYSYMPFAKEYDLSEKQNRSNEKKKSEYIPCPKNQLHKIRLGWNIGMKDYRPFPFSKFYPIGTSRLLNRLYPLPSFKNNEGDRPIDSTFRGKVKPETGVYSYQRNKVIELFKKEKYPELVTGPILPKRKYLDELRNSKTCISPFGWGEVCYRDFEAVLNGALLIKPDMSHLETFPNIYKRNETYVPLRWDMTDLEETLNKVLDNYENYVPIIKNSRREYEEVLSDSDRFISHFKKIIH